MIAMNCEFSSGEIKNENTVGFTLECLSEGSLLHMMQALILLKLLMKVL